MTRLLAIARNAFVETVRQPVFGVLIFLTFVVLVLDVPLSSWTMGAEAAEYKRTDQQLLVNLGLSTLLVSGLLVSAFGAAGVVSREIRDRTILTVVSKPLPRGLVVLGKFLGVAAAVAVAYWLCSLAFLMTVRHGVMPTVTDPYDVPVIVLGCSALAGSIVAAAWPDLKFFYALDALVQEKAIPAAYVALAGAYAGCLIAAVLAVGVALFQTRELEDTPSGAPLGVSVLAVLGRLAAAVVAVGAAVAVLRFVSAWSVLAGLAWLAGAGVSWVFWGWFGRGVKWTYWLLLACVIGGVGLVAAELMGAGMLPRAGKPVLAAAGLAAAGGLLILLLPKTRHHFGLIRKRARRAPGRAA